MFQCKYLLVMTHKILCDGKIEILKIYFLDLILAITKYELQYHLFRRKME